MYVNVLRISVQFIELIKSFFYELHLVVLSNCLHTIRRLPVGKNLTKFQSNKIILNCN